MAERTGKEIMMRADTARSERDLWKDVLQDAYELAMPARNPYGQNKARPRSVTRMYESTAMSSTFKAANRMLMELTPPDQNWFDIKVGPILETQLEDNVIEEIERALAKHVQIISIVFRSGSFVSSIWESFLDLIVAGLGALLVLENPNSDTEPVLFETVPQDEISIEEGAGGEITGCYRWPVVKAWAITEKWSDARLPEDLKKLVNDKKKSHDVSLLESTYKSNDNSPEPWVYQVFWKQKDSDPVELVKRTYSTNPWVVFRWSKVPGSPYGPGPVMLAGPDIRTINSVMQMQLQNLALALSGVYLVADDGVVNPDTVVITQGGLIPVQRTGGAGGGASIVPLETGRNFDLGQIVLEDLRMMIKKSLFDNGLPPLNGNVRSATEIIERMRELSQDIGGAIGRLTNELIVPLVRRVSDILKRRGYIPELNINQYHLKVQVNSPLARVQQLQDVERVVQWLEMVMQLGGQEAMLLVAKIEEILPWIADQIGVPSDLVRDAAEREGMQEQMGQIYAMQQAGAALPAQA